MRILFEAFSKRIASAGCRVLIAIGYSFADDDVRKLVLEALKANRDLQLVLVCGSRSEAIKADLVSRFPDAEVRVQILNGHFETVLNTGALKECIEERIAHVALSAP
jgi:hypothetical protein